MVGWSYLTGGMIRLRRADDIRHLPAHLYPGEMTNSLIRSHHAEARWNQLLYYKPVQVNVLSSVISVDDSLSFARLLLPAAMINVPCSATQHARSSL